MRRVLFPLLTIFALTFLFFLPSCGGRKSSGRAGGGLAKDTIYPLGFCTDSFDLFEGTFEPGGTFSGLLSKLGMSPDSAYALIQSDTIFDLRKVRAGNNWHAYFEPDTSGHKLRYLTYEVNKLDLVVFRCFSPFDVWLFSKPVEIESKYASVTITESLWNDMIRAGVSPLLIVKLADIYAWTIDFFALQQGDSFKVLYDQKLCDGEVIDVDSVYYAVFNHAGKEFPAILLDKGGNRKGNNYWNEQGQSLRKAFLKAPLKFTRVSSGFSYHRKHPVTGKVKAHTGVDYAAPMGTPVMSIGDGTVLSAGWSGAGGNMVKIRHNSVYTTAYLHLSKFAKGIKAGARVKQGEVIGYVGSTGTSTGPHLDFRVWRNGSPINPLTMSSPSVEPLNPEYMPLLDSLRLMYSSRVDSLENLAGRN